MTSFLDKLAGRRAALWVAALGVVLLLPFLGSFGLWDPHEVKIADLAKEVIHTPGWNMPARSLRPPLTMWVPALGYRFLGGGELAARLPGALAGLATLLACFYAGTGLLRRRAALLGTLALATTPEFFLGARQLTGGVMPLLGATLAVGGLARAAWPSVDGSPGGRLGHFGLGLLGLALGFYAGGMWLGVALPLGGVAVGLLVTSGPSASPLASRVIALLAFLGAATAAILAWRHALPSAGHAAAYSPILGGTPKIAVHQVDYTTLLKQIGFGAFPWIALLPLAAGRIFAALGRGARGEQPAPWSREEYGHLVLLCWLLVTYLGHTLFVASVGEAGFGAWAAVALAAGHLLDDLWEERSSSTIAGLAALLGAAVIAHDLFMSPEMAIGPHVPEGIKWPSPLTRPPYFFLFAGLLWGLLMGLGLALRPGGAGPQASPDPTALARDPEPGAACWTAGWLHRQALLMAALATALASTLVYLHWVVPEVSKHLSYKGLFVKYKSLVGTGASEIGRYHVPGQLSEYGKTTDLPSLPSLFDFLGRKERVFVIANNDDLAAIDQHARSRAEAGGTYYVVDDSNSRFLMLSNQLGGKDQDLNPLRRFILPSLTRPPEHEVHADFEGKVELVGYDLPAEVARGSSFKITLYYKVNAPVGGAYKTFVHFDGPGSRINGDHIPLAGRFPTNYWVPGFYILDEHTMEPDRSTAPAGTYTIYSGFWLGDARLKVLSGPSDGENRVKLGTVRVR